MRSRAEQLFSWLSVSGGPSRAGSDAEKDYVDEGEFIDAEMDREALRFGSDANAETHSLSNIDAEKDWTQYDSHGVDGAEKDVGFYENDDDRESAAKKDSVAEKDAPHGSAEKDEGNDIVGGKEGDEADLAEEEDAFPENEETLREALSDSSMLVDLKGVGKGLQRMRIIGIKPTIECYELVLSTCASKGDADKAEFWMNAMLTDGIRPSGEALSCLVVANANTGDREGVHHWMRELIHSGVNVTTECFNAVISACVKNRDSGAAERFIEAMRDRGIEPTIESYNGAITACAGVGNRVGAVHWINILREAGFHPNLQTYSGLLDFCSRIGDAAGVEQWVRAMHDDGIKMDEKALCHAYTGSIRAQWMDKANFWKKKLLAIDTLNVGVLLTSLIATSHIGDREGAMQWLDRLEFCQESLRPSAYHIIVNACARLSECDAAEKWLARLIERGFDEDGIVYDTLIKAYARISNWAKAEHWLDVLVAKKFMNTGDSRLNSTNYVSLIQAHAKEGKMEELERWLTYLDKSGWRIDERECVAMVHAYAHAQQPESAERWLSRIIKSYGRASKEVYSAVIIAYAKEGQVKEAIEWSEKMRNETQRKAFASCVYSAIISASAKKGDRETAEKWFKEMCTHGIKPSVSLVTSMISACATNGDPVNAVKWLNKTVSTKDNPGDTFNKHVVLAFARVGDMDGVRRWLRTMMSAEIQMEGHLCTSILSAFSSRGNKTQNISECEHVRAFLKEMRLAKIQLPMSLWTNLLYSFAESGDLEEAKEVMLALREYPGCYTDVKLIRLPRKCYNNLINTCARARDYQKAEFWFDSIQKAELDPDSYSYNCVINACARSGNTTRAEEWIERMRRAGIQPTHVTYSPLISAFSRSGDKAAVTRTLRKMMRDADPKSREPKPSVLETPKNSNRKDHYENQPISESKDSSSGTQHSSESKRGTQPSESRGDSQFSEPRKQHSLDPDSASRTVSPRNEGRFMRTKLLDACERLDMPAIEEYLRWARENNKILNDRSRAAIVQAIRATEKSFQKKREIHRVLLELRLGHGKPNHYAFCFLLSIEEKIEAIDKLCQEIMDKRLIFNTTSAAIFQAYSRLGSREGVERWLQILQDPKLTKAPNRQVYNAILKALMKLEDPLSAEVWMERMRSSGFPPNAESWTLLTRAYAMVDDEHGALGALEAMKAEGTMPGVAEYNTMMMLYARRGDQANTEIWFNRCRSAGLMLSEASFIAMIHVSLRNGKTQSAVKWLQMMINSGLHPQHWPFLIAIHVSQEEDSQLTVSDALSCAEEMMKAIVHSKVRPTRITQIYFNKLAAMGGQREKIRYWGNKINQSKRWRANDLPIMEKRQDNDLDCLRILSSPRNR